MERTSTIDSQKDMTNEGIGDTIRLGTLLALLAVPGIMRAEDISENLPKTNTITAQAITNAIDKATEQQKTYGGYTAVQASNIVARTLYMEARSEGEKGIDAVASVLLNRAGKKAENLPDVCLKPKQFSCWNDKTNLDAKSYTIVIPKGAAKKGKDQTMWLYCQKIAGKLLNANFTSTVGNRNCYHTTSITPSWDSTMKNKTTIGKHVFGYLPEYDGSKKSGSTAPKQKTHTIKKGDTLRKIAIANNTTVDRLLELNPSLKKNPNLIKLNSKIILPN